jgi:hypothetical protein
MRPGQIPGAHQELAGDFSACKLKGLFKELNPISLRHGVMVVQPGFEAAEFCLQLLDLLSVVNGGIYLKLVADDARVPKQSFPVFICKARYRVDIKIGVSRSEVVGFFQNELPGQPGLIDFQDQPAEQLVIVGQWEAVVVVVVLPVDVAWGQVPHKFAIGSHNGLIAKEPAHVFVRFIIKVAFTGIEDVLADRVDLPGLVSPVFQFATNENKVGEGLRSIE